ncbi:MAG: radical SAM protein [Thermodesulfobacteriota bacterium]|nr:radical SAM protein [Thermodesulfobacteriota bacterium]
MCQSCQQTVPRKKLEFSPEDILDFTHSKYHKEILRFTEPHFAFWELTHSCNLQCSHCGLAAGKSKSDELDTKGALTILENISESDTRFLMLLGGEPLMRKDFVEIAGFASERFEVGVCTNGVLIDKRYAKDMKDAGIWLVGISLDGATKETHDSIRGKGTYEKTLKGIENSLDAGLQVCIMHTVSQKNIHELPGILELVNDFNIHCFEVNDFLPFGRGENISAQTLTKKQRRSMCEYLSARRWKALPPVASLPDDPFWFITYEEEYIENCFDPYTDAMIIGDTSGILCYGIKPNGKVVPFPTLRIDIGDLREEPFRGIWKNSDIIKKLKERENLKGRCGICEYKFICGGNRGVAYYYSGDMMAEDPRCWYEPTLN